ncbi:MAG: hypothetical protein ABIG96_03420 [Candidatus Micrarchaeota archaeon]
MNALRLLLFSAVLVGMFATSVPAPEGDAAVPNLISANDRMPAIPSLYAKPVITDELAKCRLMTTETDRAVCLRRIGATDNELLPFQRCKLLSDDDSRARCIEGIRENVLNSLPETQLRACAAILGEAERERCKLAVAKPAVAPGKLCEKFTDAEDIKQCRLALTEGIEAGVTLRETAYACVEKFGNDVEGKIACMRRIQNEVMAIKLDCSVYTNSDLKGRCEVCSSLADAEERSACVNRMGECRQKFEEKDKDALKACIMELKNDDERENRCKNIGDADLKAECLRTEYGLHGLKSCGDRNGTTNASCVAERKEKTEEYIGMQLRMLQNAIDKLEANGYLTQEQITAIKEYVAEKRTEFENAQTAEQKRAIIKEVLQRWEQFRKNQLFQYHMGEINKRVEIIQNKIGKVRELGAKLKEAGKDTSKLDEAISKVDAVIAELKNSKTFKEAQTGLNSLQAYVAHLMKVVAYIREGKPLTEIPNPTIKPKPTEKPKEEKYRTEICDQASSPENKEICLGNLMLMYRAITNSDQLQCTELSDPDLKAGCPEWVLDYKNYNAWYEKYYYALIDPNKPEGE